MALTKEAAEAVARRIERVNPQGAAALRGQPIPRLVPAAAPRSRWKAVPTTCPRGHRHGSRLEAKVCDRLSAELAEDVVAGRLLVFHNARVPLYCLGPDADGRPFFLNVDFLAVSATTFAIVRAIDAKPKRRAAVSRDWRRGAAAFSRTYSVAIEEASA